MEGESWHGEGQALALQFAAGAIDIKVLADLKRRFIAIKLPNPENRENRENPAHVLS